MSKPTPREDVIDELRRNGLFVRTYDANAMDRLMQGIAYLHGYMCLLDSKNLKAWRNVPLVDVVDAYAMHQHLRTLGDEE